MSSFSPLPSYGLKCLLIKWVVKGKIMNCDVENFHESEKCKEKWDEKLSSS